jgi:hypothetical protein
MNRSWKSAILELASLARAFERVAVALHGLTAPTLRGGQLGWDGAARFRT